MYPCSVPLKWASAGASVRNITEKSILISIIEMCGMEFIRKFKYYIRTIK